MASAEYWKTGTRLCIAEGNQPWILATTDFLRGENPLYPLATHQYTEAHWLRSSATGGDYGGEAVPCWTASSRKVFLRRWHLS